VYYRLTRQFVGWATPLQAEEILRREPNSLLLKTTRGRHTPSMTLHVSDIDNFILVGRRFRLSELIPKLTVYRERLSGDDWTDLYGNEYHVPAGHRVYQHRRLRNAA
jgi:hypothetical protein